MMNKYNIKWWIEEKKPVIYKGRIYNSTAIALVKPDGIHRVWLQSPEVNNGVEFTIETTLNELTPYSNELIEVTNQRIAALQQLKDELDKDRKTVEIMAPDDEYKAGYKKAMTNVFAVINEEIRITKQFGEASILV